MKYSLEQDPKVSKKCFIRTDLEPRVYIKCLDWVTRDLTLDDSGLPVTYQYSMDNIMCTKIQGSKCSLAV